jgi:hypothetical protein
VVSKFCFPNSTCARYAEVCRGQIEEGSGGAKVCSGPRGDMLDTIQRRNYTVAGLCRLNPVYP